MHTVLLLQSNNKLVISVKYLFYVNAMKCLPIPEKLSKISIFLKKSYLKIRSQFFDETCTQQSHILWLCCVKISSKNQDRILSYEFFKFSLLHKNGVNYEIHVNLPIFKKSKNGQKPHKFKNHLTSCFTKVQKLDLGWSDLKFKTFLSPAPSPLWKNT